LSSLSKKDRDAEIVRLIDKERMTMTAVAKLFGITKQRVQQIYRREKNV
jgi:DNA-directed RNA polymerase specialized sigma subunit|tara:strand:+ start:426 stop:572 length:147 start_codon:yes stop_codon:yes gene_type:complete